MYCPNCGTSNLDNATICANCGRPLHGTSTPASAPSSSAQSSYVPPPPYPPSQHAGPASPATPPAGGAAPVVYLILSILLILCCCNPLALVPMIFAIVTLSRRSAGDYTAASVHAGRAALWFWIAVVVGIIWYVIFFAFFGGMAFLEEFSRNLPQ